jgi:hypothetical protein
MWHTKRTPEAKQTTPSWMDFAVSFRFKIFMTCSMVGWMAKRDAYKVISNKSPFPLESEEESSFSRSIPDQVLKIKASLRILTI